MSVIYIFCAVVAISLIIVLRVLIKSGHFIKYLILSAFGGIASLMAVNILGLVSGVVIAVNAYSLGFSGIFGVHGTVTMLITDMIFK